MSKLTSLPSPALKRLRAAAGLVPLIESGLVDSKLGREQASLMAEFCGWAAAHELQDNQEAEKLAKLIKIGLQRLKPLLE